MAEDDHDELEVYLFPGDDGVYLVCEAEQCLQLSFGRSSYKMISLPWRCTPEQAVIIRAQHLATHVSV